jgi:hypothetical protein
MRRANAIAVVEIKISAPVAALDFVVCEHTMMRPRLRASHTCQTVAAIWAEPLALTTCPIDHGITPGAMLRSQIVRIDRFRRRLCSARVECGDAWADVVKANSSSHLSVHRFKAEVAKGASASENAEYACRQQVAPIRRDINRVDQANLLERVIRGFDLVHAAGNFR